MNRSPQPPDRPGFLPGEPGVGSSYPPPFAPRDPDTAWLFSLNRFGIRPGLARIEGLLADLGHPERSLATFVVAGTNGKGSTTGTLAALLHAAGYRVVAYTSPHLLRVHERIQIDGRSVGVEDFARRLREIRPAVERRAASWFETLTALAVSIAGDESVDFFCCETGLGGRLDASNALPAVATLLTTVDFDHEAILGSTRSAIAAEKLGLLKAGTPCFCGVDVELRDQVFRAAVAAGAPCHFLDELARWSDTPGPWDLYLRERVIAGLPDPGHSGLRRNVALALLALTELEKRGVLRLPAAPGAALANLRFPARFQRVLQQPEWIFDVGHNDQALTATLAALLARPCAGRRIVIFGGLREKVLTDAVGAGLRACDAVIAAPIALPRSRDRSELATLLSGWGLPASAADGPLRGVRDDLDAVLRDVAVHQRPTDTILVTGSCFLVAEVLHRLGYRDLTETQRVAAAASIMARLGTVRGRSAGAA